MKAVDILVPIIGAAFVVSSIAAIAVVIGAAAHLIVHFVMFGWNVL